MKESLQKTESWKLLSFLTKREGKSLFHSGITRLDLTRKPETIFSHEALLQKTAVQGSGCMNAGLLLNLTMER